MRHKYSFFGISLLVLFGGILFAGMPSVKAQNANPLIHSTRFKNPANSSQASVASAHTLPKDAVEDISKRTLFSSTWKTKNGKVIANYSSVIINYPDANGNLQPIDLTLKSDPKGWVADKQPNPCYFHTDRSTAISLGDNKEFVFNKNCTINAMPLDQHIVLLDNSDVKLDLSQGVHKELNFVTNGIKTNYVFDAPLEGGINVSEEVEFPDGCIFKKDDKVGSFQSPSGGNGGTGGWAGDYVLLAADGKQVLARFQAAECYDAAKHWCIASYSVEKKDGKNILKTTVPSGWLAKAVYPVTVDPLVTATSNWNGGSTGSGLWPAYTTDSILVTIPPNITITYFNMNYAYVTHKQTPNSQAIWLSDGVFWLSDKCARTDTISCVIDSAGICYLLPQNSQNPFTCCFSPSCSPQSFWLDAHLSRLHGADFSPDTDFVWYSKGYQGYVGTKYHFAAQLEGYTDSLINWSVTPPSQCSNNCSLTLNAHAEYGVPPYTFTHPWATIKDTIAGSYGSCVSEGIVTMNLTIPHPCPYTCGNVTTISVPPPTVVDFCGDTATRGKNIQVTLNPVPILSLHPDTVKVCSGFPVNISLLSCVSQTNFNWTGSDNTTGSGFDSLLIDKTLNTGNAKIIANYTVTGSANGCNATDTLKATGIIYPFPTVTIAGKDSIVLGTSETLTASGGGNYEWTPSTKLSCTKCPNPVASPTITTTYTVTVTDSGGVCERTSTFTIIVLDENIVIPNVITPATGGINALFFISNLQDYPNSQLVIYNRWGEKVYSSTNYLNDWNGGSQSDGVYYYVLTLPKGKKYNGFVQLIK